VAAELKLIGTELEGEFLVIAERWRHCLTCTEFSLVNALTVARKLARDGWFCRVQGQEDCNSAHSYEFSPP